MKILAPIGFENSVNIARKSIHNAFASAFPKNILAPALNQFETLASSIRTQTEWINSIAIQVQRLSNPLQLTQKALDPTYQVKRFLFMDSFRLGLLKLYEFFESFRNLSYEILGYTIQEKTRERLLAFYREKHRLLLKKYLEKGYDEEALMYVLVAVIENVYKSNPVMRKIQKGELDISIVYNEDEFEKFLFGYLLKSIKNYIVKDFYRDHSDPFKFKKCILFDAQTEYDEDKRNSLTLDNLSFQVSPWGPRPHIEGYFDMLAEEVPTLILHNEGYTQIEIARSMGISDRTVRRRLEKERKRFAYKWTTHKKLWWLLWNMS